MSNINLIIEERAVAFPAKKEWLVLSFTLTTWARLN